VMATINPGDESDHSAPYWVSYPEMVALAGGEPVPVCARRRGLQAAADALQKAITAKTKWIILCSPSNPTAPPTHATELKAITDVLVKHPSVWVMTDDMYEHLSMTIRLYDAGAGRAETVYDRTLDRERRVESLLHDRLAHRYAGGPAELIRRWRPSSRSRPRNPSSISQWARWKPSTDRRTSSPRTTRCSRSAATVCRCQSGNGIVVRAAGRVYVYPSCAGTIGKTSPSGRVIATTRFVTELLRPEAWLWCRVRHSGLAGVSISTRPDLDLEDACKRISAILWQSEVVKSLRRRTFDTLTAAFGKPWF